MVASKDLRSLDPTLSNLVFYCFCPHSHSPAIPSAWNALPPDTHMAQLFLQIREAFFATLGKTALITL